MVLSDCFFYGNQLFLLLNSHATAAPDRLCQTLKMAPGMVAIG